LHHMALSQARLAFTHVLGAKSAHQLRCILNVFIYTPGAPRWTHRFFAQAQSSWTSKLTVF